MRRRVLTRRSSARPRAAGSLLPETGASSSVTSGRSSATRAATRSIPATPIVLICTQIAPGGERRQHALVARDRHHCVGVGHHRDDDRAPAAPHPPRWRRPLHRVRQGLGSLPARGSTRSSGCPARSALVAIPWPIVPVPSTAIGSCVSAISSSSEVNPRVTPGSLKRVRRSPRGRVVTAYTFERKA